MIVKMLPKTTKAHNRIREAGTDLWELYQPPGLFKGSPAYLAQAPNNETSLRWVLEHGDPDFDFIDPKDDKVIEDALTSLTSTMQYQSNEQPLNWRYLYAFGKKR